MELIWQLVESGSHLMRGGGGGGGGSMEERKMILN